MLMVMIVDVCFGFGFGLIEASSIAGYFGTKMYMGLKAMMKNILMLLVLVLFIFKFHEFKYEVPVVSFSISFCIGILKLTRSMRYLLFHLDVMLSFLYSKIIMHFNRVLNYNILLSTFVPNKKYISYGLMKAWSFKKKTLKCRPFRLHKLKPKLKSVVGRISMIAQITRITVAREWYLDSGGTIHVVGSRNSFTTCRAVTSRQVMMANRDKADVCGVRTVQMKFTSGKTVTLHNVLHVPTISKSLVSVGKLDEDGFKIIIESRKVVITKRGLLWEKDTTKKGCID